MEPSSGSAVSVSERAVFWGRPSARMRKRGKQFSVSQGSLRAIRPNRFRESDKRGESVISSVAILGHPGVDGELSGSLESQISLARAVLKARDFFAGHLEIDRETINLGLRRVVRRRGHGQLLDRRTETNSNHGESFPEPQKEIKAIEKKKDRLAEPQAGFEAAAELWPGHRDESRRPDR